MATPELVKQQEVVAEYMKRWNYMKSARQNYEADWDLSDRQVAAET
jgi:hypothetical protein